jgi:hypothetical protein
MDGGATLARYVQSATWLTGLPMRSRGLDSKFFSKADDIGFATGSQRPKRLFVELLRSLKGEEGQLESLPLARQHPIGLRCRKPEILD